MSSPSKKCCTTSKLLQNWKQFTTCAFIVVLAYSCTTSKLLQNWKQFTTFIETNRNCCWLYNIKVITELKAIHNAMSADNASAVVVQHQSYYRIESNSQLTTGQPFIQHGCTTSKLLQNWKQFTTRIYCGAIKGRLYNIKVITELKAIHN